MLDSRVLLEALADGRFCSGAELARRHGVSRTTIAQGMRLLEQEYRIEVQRMPGKGYRIARPLHLLDAERIRALLPPQTNKHVAEIETHIRLDSTNSYLMGRRGELCDAYHVVLAESQSGGRGRNGRSWSSGFATQLAMSIGWRRARRMDSLAGLSLVVGLAVANGLRAQGYDDVGLKWPNDLYWQDRKLGGILIELSGEADGPFAIVVGIGLNCVREEFFGDIDQPVVALHEFGNEPDRNALVAALLGSLDRSIEHFHEAGFTAFEAQWREIDLLSGREVDVILGNTKRRARYLGVDAGGAAMIDAGQGVERLTGGEISLRYVAVP